MEEAGGVPAAPAEPALSLVEGSAAALPHLPKDRGNHRRSQGGLGW